MSCEMPKCFSRVQRKARKRHKCCECWGWIEPGETYQYVSGIWDGPASFKVCADCNDLRAEVDKNERDRYECTPFEGLSESVCDSPDPLNKARFVAIMIKRGAKIHWSWLRNQHAFPPALPQL
jgi:hypothetical protein